MACPPSSAASCTWRPAKHWSSGAARRPRRPGWLTTGPERSGPYGAPDPASFVEVTAKEAGRSGQLPVTLAAIDVAGDAVGAVGLDRVDDELSAAERAGRAPWIVGMVVRAEHRERGVGRQLLERLQEAAASLGHPRTWVATGDEAVGFYQGCGWAAVEHLRLESTGIPTTILMRPVKAIAAG